MARYPSSYPQKIVFCKGVAIADFHPFWGPWGWQVAGYPSNYRQKLVFCKGVTIADFHQFLRSWGGRWQDILPTIVQNWSSVRASLSQISIFLGDFGGSFLMSGSLIVAPKRGLETYFRAPGGVLEPRWPHLGHREGSKAQLRKIPSYIFLHFRRQFCL